MTHDFSGLLYGGGRNAGKMAAEIDRLYSRIETLEAALRPFAVDMLQPKHDRLDDAWRMPGDWYTEITVGDLRRAKEAYEADQ